MKAVRKKAQVKKPKTKVAKRAPKRKAPKRKAPKRKAPRRAAQPETVPAMKAVHGIIYIVHNRRAFYIKREVCFDAEKNGNFYRQVFYKEKPDGLGPMFLRDDEPIHPTKDKAPEHRILITDESDPGVTDKDIRNFVCPSCKIRGGAASHKSWCTALRDAKRHGMGIVQWSKACRKLSGFKGEEVRCVLPAGHGGLHQWPTSEAEREEQLKKGNLKSLIEEAEREETVMAKKVEQVKAGKAEKAEKAEKAAKGGKGNTEALEQARAARSAAKQKEEEAMLKKRVHLMVEGNPKRAAPAKRFALYKNNMKVADYIKAGGTLADVKWDIGKNYIELK